MFPVLAQITASRPSSFALLIAIVIPRSLKDPVGLRPSYFKKTFVPFPIKLLIDSLKISGVFPSFREIIGVCFVTGRYCL